MNTDQTVGCKVDDLYQSEQYLHNHPSLHQEDSEWKFEKLIPFLDSFGARLTQKTVSLLDIGGGAGLVLRQVANYLENKHLKKVRKYALDLSYGALVAQRKVNPDLENLINGDFCMAPLPDNAFDLTLMIDVLEHLENPEQALGEIRRVSSHAIFKVPLENNLYSRLYNYLKRGEPRRHAAEHLGHINHYNIAELTKQISETAGEILMLKFADVFSYYLGERHYKNSIPGPDKMLYHIGRNIHRLSPKFASYFLNDFAILLIRCF